MATITVKAGKRTLKLTPAQAKDLHRQLDSIFEGQKAQEAARRMAEFADKWRPRHRRDEEVPLPHYTFPAEIPYHPTKTNPTYIGDPPGWMSPTIICRSAA